MADETLDADGQPLNEGFNWRRRLDSRTDELIGLCRGVLADERLNLSEAEYVHQWLRRNPPVLGTEYGFILHDALAACLHDGVLTDEEEDQLVDVLLRFTGKTPDDSAISCSSTRLPLCDPPPRVDVASHAFCFTGKFTFGSRVFCETTVLKLTGIIHKSPTLKTGYLVIGDLGSRDWIHSNSGRKMRRPLSIATAGAASASSLKAIGPHR